MNFFTAYSNINQTGFQFISYCKFQSKGTHEISYFIIQGKMSSSVNRQIKMRSKYLCEQFSKLVDIHVHLHVNNVEIELIDGNTFTCKLR